jgi:hypothetical protein
MVLGSSSYLFVRIYFYVQLYYFFVFFEFLEFSAKVHGRKLDIILLDLLLSIWSKVSGNVPNVYSQASR